MTSDRVPQGLPFNLVYMQRPAPTHESAKARKRIAAYVEKIDHDYRMRIAQHLRQELAAEVSSGTLNDFLISCSLHDFLSSLTYVFLCLPSHEQYTRAMPKADWLDFVRRVFSQESITFEIDPKGGVHPAPDLEFVAAKASTITALSQPRYEAARLLFERSLVELKSLETSSIAIRHTFDACENIFKLMFNSCSRLGETEIEKALRPNLKQLLSVQDFDASSAMATAFKSWITAAHQFRHAAGTEAPAAASYNLTVLMISTGAAYIRWLISIDELMLTKQASQ